MISGLMILSRKTFYVPLYKGFKLKEIVLGIKSMDFQKCSASNVVLKRTSILQDFDIESTGKITDRTSNITKARESQNRINCINHLLNNVLYFSLNKTQALQTCFDACKVFQEINTLQHMQSTSLKNDCVTS